MSTIFEQPKAKISLNPIKIKGIFKNKENNCKISRNLYAISWKIACPCPCSVSAKDRIFIVRE